MEFRKRVTITLYARQQKRHRCIEQSFGLCGRGQGWDDLGEWHWNMYIIKCEMNLPQVYMCSPSWTLLPPPSPYHPSGLSQCTSPKHPVSCIKPGLATRFIHDILHVSMLFSQISPPSPSPTESIRLIYTSVSLLLSRTQGYCYPLSKFHIYALVYCIGVFPSGLLHSV